MSVDCILLSMLSASDRRRMSVIVDTHAVNRSLGWREEKGRDAKELSSPADGIEVFQRRTGEEILVKLSAADVLDVLGAVVDVCAVQMTPGDGRLKQIDFTTNDNLVN